MDLGGIADISCEDSDPGSVGALRLPRIDQQDAADRLRFSVRPGQRAATQDFTGELMPKETGAAGDHDIKHGYPYEDSRYRGLSGEARRVHGRAHCKSGEHTSELM